MGITVDRPLNIERGYYVDDEHEIIWVPPPKCASRSMHAAIKPWHREVLHGDAKYLNVDYFTVAVIRHPWDRIVAALWGPLRTFEPFWTRVHEQILQYQHENPLYMDPHVRPQAFTLRDLQIDFLMRVDQIDADWAELRELFPHLLEKMPHKHKGQARPEGWKGQYTWSRLLPQYEEDFKLCQDWER